MPIPTLPSVNSVYLLERKTNPSHSTNPDKVKYVYVHTHTYIYLPMYIYVSVQIDFHCAQANIWSLNKENIQKYIYQEYWSKEATQWRGHLAG